MVRLRLPNHPNNCQWYLAALKFFQGCNPLLTILNVYALPIPIACHNKVNVTVAASLNRLLRVTVSTVPLAPLPKTESNKDA
jgi:hypothetical protein